MGRFHACGPPDLALLLRQIRANPNPNPESCEMGLRPYGPGTCAALFKVLVCLLGLLPLMSLINLVRQGIQRLCLPIQPVSNLG